MPFSVSRMIVDGNQNVVALDWEYANADGTLRNTWKLQEPYGSTPLADVTESISVEWLQEQLPNTVEQFDAAIAERKAEAEYDETLVPYQPNPSGPPTPITMPVPDEEIEAAPKAKSTKKK